MESGAPYILEETGDFAVVYKPPRMHCVPNKQKKGDTLFEWYGKGKLMHRLDFETHGLVLFAKNKRSFEFFYSLQERGEFIKEYSAICVKADNSVPVLGFPAPPVFCQGEPSPDKPLVIESFFRPFGPGRKQVRPVTDDGKKRKETAKDKGAYYRTEITGIRSGVFFVRIRRGFRHQIRCHLCWAGFPILNDPLYPVPVKDKLFSASGILALRAQALFFIDPSNGGSRVYRIAPLEKTQYFSNN